MTKKFWLFILSFITILWIWTSFADVIEPNTHYVDRCVRLQNVEIDWYKAIQVIKPIWFHSWEFYEIKENECLYEHYKFWQSYVYLVEKSSDIKNFNPSNYEQGAILVGVVYPNWRYIDNWNPLTKENITYMVVKRWNKYKLKLVESSSWIFLLDSNRLIEFWIARLLTILIETIILFIIAKMFRKKDQISNWKLILIWILASTITLPLLRFVLPLFIVDGVEYMVIWELLVTIIEVFIIKYWLKVSRRKAILTSVICNLFSYLIWLFIF